MGSVILLVLSYIVVAVVVAAWAYWAGRRFSCEACGRDLPVRRVWCGDPCQAPRDEASFPDAPVIPPHARDATLPGWVQEIRPDHAQEAGIPPEMDAAVRDVLTEYLKISARFAAFNSGHEAYGVLAEEVDELWDEVKRKEGAERDAGIRREGVQVAAVALRIVTEFGPGVLR